MRKEKLIKVIQKNITRMVEVSKQGLTHQQCLIDISQVAFNFVCSKWFWQSAFPKGDMFHEDFMEQELTSYKKDPEAWELLGTAVTDYWELVKLCEPFTDVMHLIGYSSQKLSKALGQFLTPPAVADGLFRLTCTLPELETGEDILVGDPAGCGAGSLLLGWLRYAHELHPTRLNQVHMFAVDLDPKMVRITALQITLSCIFHKIPLGSLSIHCCNAIIDYKHYAFGSTKYLAYGFASDLNRHASFNLKNRAEAMEPA